MVCAVCGGDHNYIIAKDIHKIMFLITQTTFQTMTTHIYSQVTQVSCQFKLNFKQTDLVKK